MDIHVKIKILNAILTDKTYRTIERSGLFDREWYLAEYPDVVTAGVDPLVHYIKHGAAEGRNPNPLFHGYWYLEQNPSIATADVNPLIDFIECGVTGARDPSPLFFSRWYLDKYRDVAKAGVNPLYHFLVEGGAKGYDPNPLFDTDWYVSRYEKAGVSGDNAIKDYIRHASTGTRDPHPLFDSAWYLKNNPDVAAARIDPLCHYLAHGAREGRDPSPHFDTDWYLARYPEVASARRNPLIDYVEYGALNDRDPNPNFEGAWYLAQYPDVAAAGANPLAHYLHHGKAQGRRPRPDSDREVRSVLLPVPHEPWHEAHGDAWERSFHRRLSERMQDLGEMDLSRPIPGDILTFSITTTVFDTQADFLLELADTVRSQAFADFEWLILDNGSSDPATIAALAEIAESDYRFKLYRVERNLHIIGGNRYLLDKVSGRYIVPVDSDDVLYRDSLALFANALRQSSSDLPSLLFSDEQKLTEDGIPSDLIWRWNFTFAQAMATVPAAHLMAFSAEIGRRVGVYSDEGAKGSHDWDSLLRITELGGSTIHVPEVLYGWRAHKQSTAGSVGAKDYIEDSHSKVLLASLRRRNMDGLFSISALFGGLGWYQLRREAKNLPIVELVYVLGEYSSDVKNLEHNLRVTAQVEAKRKVVFPRYRNGLLSDIRSWSANLGIKWIPCNTDEEVLSRINAVEEAAFAKIIISSSLRLLDGQGVLDAIGTFEIDPRAAVASGPIVSDSGLVLNAGLLAGVGRFIASPFYGWAKNEVPGHIFRTPRSITAAPTYFMAIRNSVIAEVGGLRGLDTNDAIHGTDFSQRCSGAGFSIVYTPTMLAYREHAVAGSVGEGTAYRARLGANAPLAPLARAEFSPHLSRVQNRFGFLELPAERQQTQGVDYAPFAPAVPLNLEVDPELSDEPTINLLLPAVRMSSMSGGPNTALNLAYRLAAEGFALRILSTDLPAEANVEPIIAHIQSITGITSTVPVEILSANDRSVPVKIGAKDIFMATAWWTAQMAKYASHLVDDRPFLYLIQDFEPILYAASSLHVQALETYSLPHIPVVNTSLLKEFLTQKKIGNFSDARFAESAISFEPAIDREAFYPEDAGPGKRRLLFYARPHTAVRNLFEIGLAALRAAVGLGILSPLNWTFVGMGEAFAPVGLGGGAVLECAPWLGFEDYAEQMRQSDILLSLMASPHPSYPPYEMAACGGVVVTNTYENKSEERLAAISENIVGAAPTVEQITIALEKAVARLDDTEARRKAANVNLPTAWSDSFADVIAALKQRLEEQGLAPGPLGRRLGNFPIPKADGPKGEFLDAALAEATRLYDVEPQPGLLSFVTTVWNTPAEFIDILSRSLRSQRGGTHFEWFVLDNGSTNPDTLRALQLLGEEEFVRLERVEANLGIVGGMRYCLERAKGRYIIPLDSDDYVFPQTVQTLTWYIQKHRNPPLLYTDEALLTGSRLLELYLKPDWDPVLFMNSCYIAHLGIIDRSMALEYGVYGDAVAEGSHDWDTFTRFMLAGHTPVHIPELLYAWRIHEQSTAGNIESKPFIVDSQRAVLSKFLAAQKNRDLFEVVKSPLFGNTPDWWLRRRRAEPRPMTTIVLRLPNDSERRREVGWSAEIELKAPSGVDHQVFGFGIDQPLVDLADFVQRHVGENRLVHLVAGAAQPDDDEWYWEAIGQLELYPDAVMVGGRIHSHNTILSAGYVFGFEDGCGCPDRGRGVSDPGYYAQMWKQHSVHAISAQHAVMRADFLLEVIRRTAALPVSAFYLGQWAGALACRFGKRVIYSPFLSAGTRSDWDALASADEKALFRSAFADLLAAPPLTSPYLGRTAATAYTPSREAPIARAEAASAPQTKPLLTATHGFLREQKGAPEEIRFSFLTTLYLGTDAGLFERTATTVLDQWYTNWEWCILAHGPITPTLDLVLRRLANDRRIRIKRLPSNLGIVGGMRYVFEQAGGEYIVPLDGDDLLTVDCLRVLTRAIREAAAPPPYLYSDEDIVIGAELGTAFLRPSWDPVLDLENSWIWHVTAFRRDVAEQVGVYSDAGSEYCHDWDTLSRFVEAGYKPAHVPEILYHWRHHASSTSNSEQQNRGSAESVHSLLTRKVRQHGLSERCEIAPYPIYRGAMEWWIRRKPVDLPTIHRVVIGSGKVAATDGPSYSSSIQMPRSAEGFEQLRKWSAKLAADCVVALRSSDVVVTDEEGLLEAVKIFEFCSDVGVVSGKVVQGDYVHSAGLSFGRNEVLDAPYDGRPVNDAGHYAMAWKPQCIAVPVVDLCFVRGDVLKSALAELPEGCSFSELGLWLGVYVRQRAGRTAYSPLIVGELKGEIIRARHLRMDMMCWNLFSHHLAPKDVIPEGAKAEVHASSSVA